MTMQATKQAARRAPCARLRAQAQALARFIRWAPVRVWLSAAVMGLPMMVLTSTISLIFAMVSVIRLPMGCSLIVSHLSCSLSAFLPRRPGAVASKLSSSSIFNLSSGILPSRAAVIQLALFI